MNQGVNPRARAQAEADVLASERAKMVVELRLQGYEFADIAEKCGYASASGAFNAWKRYLRGISKSAVEEAREEVRMRLYRAMRQLEPLKGHGDPRAHEAYVKLEDRYCKLMGLDVPVKQDAPAAPPIIREYPDGLVSAV